MVEADRHHRLASGKAASNVPFIPTDMAHSGHESNRFRVLHVYSGNLAGGIESFLRTIARCAHFVPGTQTEFALCFEGALARDLRAAGARVHPLGHVRLRDPRLVRRARQGLARVLDGGRYDAVVCHSAWPHLLFAPIVRAAASPRLAHFMHDVPNATGWIDHLARWIPPDVVLCNSDFTARSGPWLFRGVPRRVVHLPVRLDVYAEQRPLRTRLRRVIGARDDAVVVLQASRLQSWKGHPLLLEALARIRTAREWECWIAGGVQRPGEERYERRLWKTVVRLGLFSRVRFLGQRTDVPAVLAAADIYCQPNTRPEPFGLAFVEALAAGLPVVATRMGGAIEIVSPSCGTLVDANPDAVAAALTAYIESAPSRAVAAEAGPRRARDLCDPESCMKALDRALRDGSPIENATRS